MTRSSPWIGPVALIALVGGAGLVADFVSAPVAVGTRFVAGTVAVVAIVWGARHYRAVPIRAWWFMAFGIAVWVLGDALWDSLDIVGADPDSLWWSAANVLYLITYPALFAAIVLIVRAQGSSRSVSNLIDCAIFSLAGILILRLFVIDSDFNGNTIGNVFDAAFPYGDALLFGAVIWLLFATGLRNPSAWLLVVGMATMLTTDVAWDLEVRHALAWDAWIDVGYTLSYGIIAAAAVHPAVTHLTDPVGPARRHVHPVRLVLLSASLVVVAFIALKGNGADLATGVCTVLLVLAIGFRFAILVRDSERVSRQADINESRFRILATAAPVGILEADSDLRVVFANEETERLFGVSVLGYSAHDLMAVMVDDTERATMRLAIGSVLSGRRATAQIRVRDVAGHEHWIAWYGTPAREGPGRFAGAFVSTVDITALKDAEAMLALQATHDALTGLPNRRLLFDRLSQALARLARQPGSVAVLFLDLDRFKPVNDELGHDAGDELLEIIAGRILATLRAEDTVARFGGDEFVVLLEHVTGREDAAQVAAKIIEAVGEPVQLTDGRADVGASIGIAISADASDDPDSLLRDADTAMYLAKGTGRSRFRFSDEAAVVESGLSRVGKWVRAPAIRR